VLFDYGFVLSVSDAAVITEPRISFRATPVTFSPAPRRMLWQRPHLESSLATHLARQRMLGKRPNLVLTWRQSQNLIIAFNVAESARGRIATINVCPRRPRPDTGGALSINRYAA